MRPIPFPRRPGALLLAALLPGPALAQTPPSAAEAQALERQATAALGALLPGAKLPPHPVQLTAEGDHYRVRIPLGAFGVARIEPPDAAFTADAKPLGGTLWSLADQRLPAEFTFTAAQSVPDPPDAKPNPSGRHEETVAYTVKLGQQDSAARTTPRWQAPPPAPSASRRWTSCGRATAPPPSPISAASPARPARSRPTRRTSTCCRTAPRRTTRRTRSCRTARRSRWRWPGCMS